jgi:3-hydroxyisobutyrate dehydrogenase-like beta-hydroxyacid dehydrogenase
MTADPPRPAVLGVGTMGAAMAATALRAGLPLAVWDGDQDITIVTRALAG